MTDTKNAEAMEPEAKAGESAQATPFLSVLKGNPSAEETAALTVLFAGLAASAQTQEDKGPRNDWGRLEEGFHQPKIHLPGHFLNVTYY